LAGLCIQICCVVKPSVAPDGGKSGAIDLRPEILAGDWPKVWKLALTYAMPFLVTSYGIYAVLLDVRG
jgi:hypothetical protein